MADAVDLDLNPKCSNKKGDTHNPLRFSLRGRKMANSKVLLSPSKSQKPLLTALIFELHSEIKIIMSFLYLTKKCPDTM